MGVVDFVQVQGSFKEVLVESWRRAIGIVRGWFCGNEE